MLKSRRIAVVLIASALAGLIFLPATALASLPRQEASETPPPTVPSCLTLPPEEQSSCFATKVASEEQLRQTQEVIGVTATAQAIEQQIQGTIASSGATPTPPATAAAGQVTPEGFSVTVPGLDAQLNLLGLVGLAMCGVGGIVLIALGVYLVRGAGGEEEEEEAPPVSVPATTAEMQPDVRPLIRDVGPPPAPASPPSARAVAPPLPVAPAPTAEAALPEFKAPPTPASQPATPGYPTLILANGQQVPVTSADFSIGRAADNDFVVDARFPGYENVSAEHARLVLDAKGRWLVEDLGSANGTFVNGRPTTLNVLRDGWRVGLGPVEFIFRLRSPEGA